MVLFGSAPPTVGLAALAKKMGVSLCFSGSLDEQQKIAVIYGRREVTMLLESSGCSVPHGGAGFLARANSGCLILAVNHGEAFAEAVRSETARNRPGAQHADRVPGVALWA